MVDQAARVHGKDHLPGHLLTGSGHFRFGI